MNKWKVGDRAHALGVIGSDVRIMAIAEGWAMVRNKGAMPFCHPVNKLVSLDSKEAESEKKEFFKRLVGLVKMDNDE